MAMHSRLVLMAIVIIAVVAVEVNSQKGPCYCDCAGVYVPVCAANKVHGIRLFTNECVRQCTVCRTRQNWYLVAMKRCRSVGSPRPPRPRPTRRPTTRPPRDDSHEEQDGPKKTTQNRSPRSNQGDEAN